jgi:hypothetical protein
MTVAGALLVLGLRRAAPDAVRGSGATAVACVVAAVLAGAVASTVPSPGTTVAASLVSALLLAAVAAIVFVGVLGVLRPAALRVLRDV